MGLVALLFWGSAIRPSAAASDEVRIGVPHVPPMLDPSVIVGGTDAVISRLAFEGLVEVGERGEIEPGLATQWFVSRDGLTWTFRLRPDVRFHNGAPLTPDDVVASLARHIAPEEPQEPAAPWVRFFRGPARLVREVRRGEAGTVRLQLSQPFSPILAVLAHPALAVVTQRGSDSRFFGTGPYRPTEAEAGRLVLVATAGGPEGPRAQRLVFSETADDAAGVAGLAPRGALDLSFAQTPPGWAGLGLQVLSAPTWQVGFLALRSERGALSRKAVRQAVALSLDPALVRSALGRWAVTHPSYVPPGAWAARESPPPPFDLVRARALLAQVGVPEPGFTLVVPETPRGVDTARLGEAIRVSLAAAGVRVSVRAEPADVAAQTVRRGEADLALVEAALAFDDPHFLFQPLLASEATTPGSATNVAFFRSQLADGILLRASQLGFRPERFRLYQRLQTYLAEEVPYVPLYVRLQWVLARPAVRDLRLDPSGLHRLERVWVEADTE